jgi:hypothetical protein
MARSVKPRVVKTAVTKRPGAEAQIRTFMAKYLPNVARDARTVRRWLQQRLPGAYEFVYDNYNWLVIGFGPTPRPSDAVFSVVLAPRWVTLCFLEGAALDDPHKLLRGGGKQVRNLRLDDVTRLRRPEVQELIDRAIDQASAPFDAGRKRSVLIRAALAKHRPRRPKAGR